MAGHDGQIWVTVWTLITREYVCTYLVGVLFSIQCPNLSSSSTPLWWTRGLLQTTQPSLSTRRRNCWSLDVRQLCHMLPSPITFHNANAFHCSTCFENKHLTPLQDVWQWTFLANTWQCTHASRHGTWKHEYMHCFCFKCFSFWNKIVD